MKITHLTLACLFITPMVLADKTPVYTWIDENNVVHYSQNQPVDVQHYNEISVAVAYDSTDPKPDVLLANTESKTPALNQKEAAARAKLIDDNCKTAQTNLKVLDGFEVIRIKEPNGEERILTPEEKKTQLELSKKHAEIYCSPDNKSTKKTTKKSE